MYYIDYHIHSHYSYDCSEKIENICKQAIKNKINEIAITDHLDILKDKPYNHSLDLDSLFLTIEKFKEKYKNNLIILQGIELGQPYLNEVELKKVYEKYKFDFIIGSVHHDEDGKDISKYNFSKIDCYSFYKKYLEKVKILARSYDYDVLGHLTYPLRYMVRDYNINIDITKFEQDFKEIFNILINRGKGIEVNTSGIFVTGEPLPPYYVLKLYKESGGEILTIGSDSHKYEYVGYKVNDIIEKLKELGFNKISTYHKRKLYFKTI